MKKAILFSAVLILLLLATIFYQQVEKQEPVRQHELRESVEYAENGELETSGEPIEIPIQTENPLEEAASAPEIIPSEAEFVVDSAEPEVEEVEEHLEPQIFFDLRQFLHNSATAASKAVGVSNLFWYSVKHKCRPDHIHLQKRLFDFIDFCTKQPRSLARYNNELLPKIMYEWVCGRSNSQKIIDQIINCDEQADKFFKSQEEKQLVLSILNLFEPSTLANLQRLDQEMLKFLKILCQKYPDQIYILSNWDRESAELVMQNFPEIFQLIKPERIVLSHQVGLAKPETALFELIMRKFKLRPSQCILVDECSDSLNNAQKLGWQTVKQSENNAETIQAIKKLLG